MKIAFILLLTMLMNIQKPVANNKELHFNNQNIKVYGSSVTENLRNY